LVALAPALAAALVAGACGSSHANSEAAKPVNQILTDADGATGGASSVHISGSVTSGGTPIHLDVVDGHNHGGGSVTVDGLTFRTVLDGQNVYLKGDAATWAKAANASVAKLLANRWLKTTTGNHDFSDFPKLLDLPQVVANLKASGKVVKQGTTKIDGRQVVALKDTGPDSGTLYVATTGPPYIVAVTGGGTNSGTLHFSGYGSAQPPGVPAGAIDLDSLENGSGI
jgi:hypothetical protein